MCRKHFSWVQHFNFCLISRWQAKVLVIKLVWCLNQSRCVPHVMSTIAVIGPIWKKASASWLLFQIKRAKVWSSRWVENDKRKGFGGVVENCGLQNRFFLSVCQGRRRGMRWTLWVSISLWFAADVGARPRWPSLLVTHWSVRVVARKYSGRPRVAEGHFGEFKCAYGSRDEFLALLFFRVFIIRSSESWVSVMNTITNSLFS